MRPSETQQRLARIMAAVEQADAEWLAAQFEAPWQRRRRRLERRDQAVRDAASVVAGQLAPTAAARELARCLDRYLGGQWQHDRGAYAPSPGGGIARSALHHLARCNNGMPLGWRQIANILSGSRGR